MDLKTINEKIIDYLDLMPKISRQDLSKELGIDSRYLNRNTKKLLTENRIIQEKVGREVYYSRKVITPIIEITAPATTPERQAQSISVNEPKQRRTMAQLVVKALKQSGREMSQQELMPLSGLRSRNFAKKMARYIQSGEVAKRKVAHEMVWWYISETTTRRRPPQIKNTNLEMLVNRIAPLQDFCKHLDTISYARCTWELYSKHIVDFYKFKSGETNKNFVVYDPEQLTRRDFDDFIAHCRHDHQNSENTIKDIFTAMKSYFNFLTENHYIVENFLAKIKIPIVDEKNAVGLSIDEFKQMLAKAKNYRDKVLLLFLFATGARVGEVESFTIPDIHWQTNQVTIFGEKRKRVRSRRLPRPVDIPPHIMTYLKKYIEKDRPIPLKIDEQAVFLNQNRTNLKGRQIEAIVRKIRIAAGIQKKVVVHSFRHACITHLYNNGHGMSIKDIAKHVGHTRESQTYAYIVIIEEERSASYQQTHPLTQSILTNEIAAIIASKEAPGE